MGVLAEAFLAGMATAKWSEMFWSKISDTTGLRQYLHNDIVTECPRKHGIDRIERFFVTTKPTDALYQNGKRLFDSFREFRQAAWTQEV
eukprot:s1288_g15.t2